MLMKNLARTVWNTSFGLLEGQYERELCRAVGVDCGSLLDVGCGFNSPVQCLSPRPPYMMGVDGFASVIEESCRKAIHDEYRQISVLEIENMFAANSFDVVLASDVIEHVSKEDGFRLIEQMERIAKRKVIIYTPNGFLPQGEEFGNPFQRHLSGWTVDEMVSRGYCVTGIEGVRWLRGEMARILWRPRHFWLAVSLLSQGITRKHPRWAFRILCIKEKGSSV